MIGATAHEPRRLDHQPAVMPSYLRALIRRPAGGELPAVELLLPDVAVDRARLAAYAAVCGFPVGDIMPPTYPHVLAFPAALALMTRRDFPLPALGLVHIANRITVRRPIGADERLTLRVRAENRRERPAGAAFDIVAVAASGDEDVWSSASTYLSRRQPRGFREPRERRPAESPQPPAPQPPATESPVTEPPTRHTEVWRVAADTGRRYGAVSGDRNPIHLSAATARLFGFRHAIAHGMWTKARALAALADRLPAAYTVEVTFRAPVQLPSSVRFTVAGATAFAVTSADGERTHLTGESR